MATEPAAWRRDWAVAPGEILLEALQERGLSQSELARRMDRPIKTINEIVNGKAAITPETAIQLELALGISGSFWNSVEAKYREYLARERVWQDFQAHASWADAFPVKDLVQRNLIERGSTKGETVASLLAYFGVSSPNAWENQWLAPAASYRASPAFASSPHAVAAWLRWGEILAEDVDVQAFDVRRLRQVLYEVRALTRREPFMQTIARVRDLCASAGVVLLLTPEFSGTRLSGAARWLSPDKAIIQLSLRHKSNDHFWFSLFHEAGHLLRRKHEDFVDAADMATDSTCVAEQKADRVAKDILMPPEDYGAFIARGTFTADTVRSFAKEQRIAPGIVVGRLQREGHLDRSHLNDLKKRIHPAAMT